MLLGVQIGVGRSPGVRGNSWVVRLQEVLLHSVQITARSYLAAGRGKAPGPRLAWWVLQSSLEGKRNPFSENHSSASRMCLCILHGHLANTSPAKGVQGNTQAAAPVTTLLPGSVGENGVRTVPIRLCRLISSSSPVSKKKTGSNRRQEPA